MSSAESSTWVEASDEAKALTRELDFIDMHLDTFIPMRLWNYDPNRSHGPGFLRGRFAGHADIPRMQDAGVSGAMWSITTNPFRRKKTRATVVDTNFSKLRNFLNSSGVVTIVRDCASYEEAKRNGKHAVFLAIQGGNALDHHVETLRLPDQDLLRVTLVHLTNSDVGRSSNPWQVRRGRDFGAHGEATVNFLNEKQVFVDLAHIHPDDFWRALKVHDATQPCLVTHTGVSSVTPHWRNVSDDQMKAIAETGGVVGVMFHKAFIKIKGIRDSSLVIEHLVHAISVVGEDHVGIGSDFDGAITPPKDLRSASDYPRLVQRMLDRGWSASRIAKILGGNFLRALKQLRG